MKKQLDRLLIGLIVPLSGPAAPLGLEAETACLLSLRDFRKAKPRLGSHIKLIITDDQGTEKGAIKAAESLISKRAHILIGSIFSPISQALVDISSKKKLALIIPHPWRKTFLGSNQFVFSSSSPDHWDGFILGKFAAQNLKLKKTGLLLNPQDRKAHDLAESYQRAMSFYQGKKEKPIIHKLLYTEELLSFDSLLERLVRQGAELILVPSSDLEESARIMEAHHRLGLKQPLLGPNLWRDKKLKDLVPSSYGGHYYPLSFSAEAQVPIRVKKFIQDFEQKTGRKPGLLAAMVYDALQLAAHAFAKEGHTRRLNYHLSELINVAGLMGPMHMGRKRVRKSALIMQTESKEQAEARVISLVELSKSDWERKLRKNHRFKAHR